MSFPLLGCEEQKQKRPYNQQNPVIPAFLPSGALLLVSGNLYLWLWVFALSPPVRNMMQVVIGEVLLLFRGLFEAWMLRLSDGQHRHPASSCIPTVHGGHVLERPQKQQ